MIIGTAGHVDHGKTALVRALTGVNTDRLPEEQKRGITIELGFAPLAVPGVGIAGVVDVPGHEDLVRTMVAGAAGVDVGLVVVAADEGVMPQTREHVAILDLLGVRHAVVALTKCDLVPDDVLAARRAATVEFLAGTSLAGSPVVATSAETRAGLDALLAALATVLQAARPKDDNDLVRLPVDRVFTRPGAGTVVTGTLWSGQLALGDELVLLPAQRRCRVRALQIHGTPQERAGPGYRVAVALAGVERSAVRRGDFLAAETSWQPTGMLRADVVLLDGAERWSPRTRLRLHLGTRDVGARVLTPRSARPGEEIAARVVLDEPVPARGGDRFILRRGSPSATIGGGVVTDGFPPRRRSRAFDRAGLSVTDRLTEIVRESGLEGVRVTSVPIRLGVPPAAVARVVGDVPELVCTADRIWSRGFLDDALARGRGWLVAYHAAHPYEPGAPVARWRDGIGAPPGVGDLLLAMLVERGSARSSAGLVALSGWQPEQDDRAMRIRDQLARELTDAGAAVPSVRELERRYGAAVHRALRELERQGLVVALSNDRFAASSAARALWDQVSGALSPSRLYSPSELRAVFGVSRQFLMPWLEYFDRVGYSHREGEGRRFKVGAAAG